MAQLLAQDLEDEVEEKLQSRARRHGRSVSEEVREILRTAIQGDGGHQEPLGSRIVRRFAAIGLEEEIPELRRQRS